jgi:ATP:corrinoid adenosyltransferase
MATLPCPICKFPAQATRTEDATAYHCAGHGDFKVADTVAADAKAKANDYTREQWEAALEKAQERTEDDEWPLIVTDDFS